MLSPPLPHVNQLKYHRRAPRVGVVWADIFSSGTETHAFDVGETRAQKKKLPPSVPLIGALIAVQKPVAEGDKVTAWQHLGYGGTGQFDPGTVVAVHGDGTYDVRFDKPAYRKPAVLRVAESKILESRPQLVDYKPTHGGGAEGRRHLKAGVLYQGLLMLLEMIGFLYWDAESKGGKWTEQYYSKCSLAMAGHWGPDYIFSVNRLN